ncbi:MAG: YdcF family protein [Patescibacteria group bacterium]|jgi:hypothetical protein
MFNEQKGSKAYPEYDPTDEDSEISRLYKLIKEQPLEQSDAAVWLEGEADDRNVKCIRIVQSDYAPKLVLSGGVDKAPTDIPSQKMAEVFVQSGISRDQIIIDPTSLNTKEQAVNVLRLVKDNDWHKIILVANPYHQIRVFLTFLAELKKQGMDKMVKIINAPADLNWFRTTARGRDEVDLFNEEEIPRLIKYGQDGVDGKKADVAKLSEGLDYIEYWNNQL